MTKRMTKYSHKIHVPLYNMNHLFKVHPPIHYWINEKAGDNVHYCNLVDDGFCKWKLWVSRHFRHILSSIHIKFFVKCFYKVFLSVKNVSAAIAACPNMSIKTYAGLYKRTIIIYTLFL